VPVVPPLTQFDMGGSGTVFGAARAIAELKPNVEVHFIVASCENMVSANAYRPGDIIQASNGKTIEVGNTDAGTFWLLGSGGLWRKRGRSPRRSASGLEAFVDRRAPAGSSCPWLSGRQRLTRHLW